MKIKLLDGTVKEYATPQTIEAIAKNLSTSLGKKVVGARLNDCEIVDKNFLVQDDVALDLITPSHPDYRVFLNHTFAFLVLASVRKNATNTQLGTVSYVPEEREFRSSFLSEPRLNKEDLKKITNTLNKLKKEKISTFAFDDEKVFHEMFKDEPFQLAQAQKMWTETGHVHGYQLGDTRIIGNQPFLVMLPAASSFELQQLTGAYWENDANQPMLQQIHGMVGVNPESLAQEKVLIQTRREADHRLLNQNLEIFGFDPLIGAGLPLWLPNGVIIKEEIKKYLREKEWEYDYTMVQTPLIGTVGLYKTSGHWEHYRDDMFQPFKSGKDSGEEFVLRPMNCPHHIAVYKQNMHSYRDLPIRLAEHALQYRYESSGSLTGLERVRAMELTDSHIFVRPDQVASEFKSIYKLIQEILKTFNIEVDYLSFSVRDPEDKEKYFPDDAMWENAEANMEKVLKELNLNYKKVVGEAAFYGPKLDIQIKTPQNHEITVSTIQLDFLLPQKFDVTYIDKDQTLKHPIMIHRGLIGTYERFIATLLEQTKGILPLWLAPRQVEIIPVGTVGETYSKKIAKVLKQNYIRAHVDNRDERLSWKIREAQTHKIPFQIVLGNSESTDETITYRRYGEEKQTTISLNEFVSMINQQILAKK